MALLIPRRQVAWKWSVEQTQAVSTWVFFYCPEGQPVHVVEHLQSKINAVQSCFWVTGRQSVETKTWGSCVSNSPLASQKFACFENVKVCFSVCHSWNLQVYVHYMQNISLQQVWIFPVEIILVAQVWKILALYSVFEDPFLTLYLCLFLLSPVRCLSYSIMVKSEEHLPCEQHEECSNYLCLWD